MKQSKLMTVLKEILSTTLYILVAIIVVYFLTEYIIQKTQVIGASMENTIHENDNIMVDKLSYRFSEPERFDIVVFPYHLDESVYYIKRIIGLPNEKVLIDEEGKIFINGELLVEDYGKEVIYEAGVAAEEILLGTDEYFVLGDNRNNSTDSRDARVGFIKKDELIGRAWLRIWPIEDFGVLRHQ